MYYTKIMINLNPSQILFQCNTTAIHKCLNKQYYSFLGGLSLHLNHLIASRMTNYDWPFGTLPFELFGSNLDTRDLETYPRTYSGHFFICHFLTIPGPFEYFSENGWSQKIAFYSETDGPHLDIQIWF